MPNAHESRSYSALLRTPGVAHIACAMVLARLPLGATTVLLVLFASGAYGSFASGLTSSLLTLGTALSSPLLGRLVDGGSGPRVLRCCSLAQLALLAAFVACVRAGAPAALAVPLALAAGLFTPPVAGTTRSLWPCLVPGELLAIAYNFEVLLVDVLYVTGPLIASAFIAAGAPAAGLLLVMAGQACGCFALAASAPVKRYAERGRARTSGASARDAAQLPGHADQRSLVTTPAIALLLAVVLCTNAFSGCFETLLPLWYASIGTETASSIVIAIWSAVSILGVLAFARLQPSVYRIGLPTQLLAFTAVYFCATLAANAYTSFPLLCVAAGLIGGFVAPCTNLHYQLAGALAERGRHAEMFSWVNTATTAGISLGAFFVGSAAEFAGFAAAFAGSSLFVLAALLLSAALRAVAARASNR